MQGPTPVVFTNGSGVSTGNTVKFDPANNAVSGTVGLTSGTTVGLSSSANTVKIDPAHNGVTPVTGGGGAEACPGSGSGSNSCPISPATATAVQVHMTGPYCNLRYEGNVVAAFANENFPAGSQLGYVALSRPIEFDEIQAIGDGTDVCVVEWIGDTP